MTVPGSNILRTALSVIGRQPFQYLQFLSRDLNNVGKYVAVYNNPVDMSGSIQPVARNLYQVYGLDFLKNYYTFFVEQEVLDPARDVSGDHIIYNNKYFQCQSITNWFSADGWTEVLCVEVPKGQFVC